MMIFHISSWISMRRTEPQYRRLFHLGRFWMEMTRY